MPTFHITSPDGKTYEVVAPDGATQEDALARIKAMVGAPAPAPDMPFGQQLNAAIKDVPRQIGLTARAGLEGLGSTVGILSDPIGATINIATGSKLKRAGELAHDVADSIGLPQPANATERVVGDAATLMASGGGMAGLAKKAAGLVSAPAARTLLQGLGADPGSQVVSGAAAGGAGGYTRETGGNGVAQGLASLAAGVAAPAGLGRVTRAVDGISNATARALAPASATPAQVQQIDITINNALRSNGMDFSQLPQNIQNGIRNDVQAALRTDGELSGDAVRRLADYRLTGATPTAATLSLDPAAVSQQKNLAKLGINSKDVAAQQLGQVENANNRALIGGINDLGAGNANTPIAAGRTVMNSLADKDAQWQTAIGARYDAARAADGRSAALDPSAFTQRAGDLLDEALLNGKLPSDVRNLLNGAATGKIPLTVDTAEQIKTRIGDLQRASSDGSERKALGLVRQALDDTPLLPGQEIGQEAIDAFNKARRLNRTYMRGVDNTPALAAVRDGVEPDKFVQTFIVGNGSKANVADLVALRSAVRNDPAALASVKQQIAAHLKSSALNGAADEVGNISQAGYNKALRQIGDEKLAMFFTPDEVNQLKAIGRVASYEQVQPRGSAVNNSNTAAAGLSAVLDRIANSPLLSKIPFGNAMIAGPAQNVSVGLRSRVALDVPASLTRNSLAPRGPSTLLLSPAALMGGNGQDDEKNSLAAGR